MNTEFRHFEVRADGRQLTGIAVKYGDVARLPWGRERIEAGAFGEVDAVDVVMNVQHDRGRPLARTGGGGLVLTDAMDALTINATLPETREANDTLALIQAGILRGLSVEMLASGEHRQGNTRVITRARLVGVAVVDSPAYPQSVIDARMKQLAPCTRRVWL